MNVEKRDVFSSSMIEYQTWVASLGWFLVVFPLSGGWLYMALRRPMLRPSNRCSMFVVMKSDHIARRVSVGGLDGVISSEHLPCNENVSISTGEHQGASQWVGQYNDAQGKSSRTAFVRVAKFI